MPIVPTYGPPNVQQAALPGARLGVQASPRAFGAGAAAGALDVADSSLNIQQRERQKQRQVRIQDWSNRLAERENHLLYDPQTGALQKRGKDAFGIAEPVLGDLDTFAGDLQKEALDGEEQQALHDLTADRRNAVQRSLMQHIAGEVRTFDDQTFGSGLASSRNAALANFNDPHRVDEEAYRQLTSIQEYAERHGLPGEWIQEQQSKAQSETYAGAIGRMIDRGDDLAAKDALKRWGGALTGDDAARIDGALKETSSRAESRRIADDLTSDPAQDMQGALAALEARGVEDVNVYDKAKDRVVEHYRLKHAAEQEADATLFQSATDAIDSAPVGKTADEIVPAQTWSSLRPSLRTQLRSYAKAKSTGIPIQTDWAVFSDLRQLARDNPQAFIESDLLEVRGSLSDEDYRSMEGLKDTLRGKDSAAGKKTFARLTTLGGAVDETLAKAGIDPHTLVKGKRNEQAITIHYQMEKQLDAHRELTGKEATPDEARQMAERLVVAQTIHTGQPTWRSWVKDALPFGFLFPDDTQGTAVVRAFEQPYAEKIAYSLDQVPADALNALRTDAAAEGVKEPSDEFLVNAYNAQLREGAVDGQ